MNTFVIRNPSSYNCYCPDINLYKQRESIPHTGKSESSNKASLPGWTEELGLVRQNYLLCGHIWIECLLC